MKLALFFFCALTLVLSGCFSRQTAMTRESFDDIQLGTSIADVTSKVGKPYSVHRTSIEKEEYEYIEKIDLGQELLYENHYYLIVVDGKVVRKQVKQERPPAFDFIYNDDPNYLSNQ